MTPRDAQMLQALIDSFANTQPFGASMAIALLYEDQIFTSITNGPVPERLYSELDDCVREVGHLIVSKAPQDIL